MIKRLWGEAAFIYRPRTLIELEESANMQHKKEYKIVKVIELSSIDYTNFITDMLADRLFIEENEEICSYEHPWKCLLVKDKTSHGGVLVMPHNNSFVGWAAIYP